MNICTGCSVIEDKSELINRNARLTELLFRAINESSQDLSREIQLELGVHPSQEIERMRKREIYL